MGSLWLSSTNVNKHRIDVMHFPAQKAYLVSPLLMIAVIFCLVGSMPIVNTGLLLVFSFLLLTYYGIKDTNWLLVISIWLITLLLGFFIAIYRPGSFNYPLIFSLPELFPGGEPFDLFANISKGLVGYIVVAVLYTICLLYTSPSPRDRG